MEAQRTYAHSSQDGKSASTLNERYFPKGFLYKILAQKTQNFEIEITILTLKKFHSYRILF